ncbi:restriction endonuclease subunit S [Chryseobacterium lineare]
MKEHQENNMLPEGWVWAKIEDISLRVHYGYTASATQNNTGIKLLRITDIQNNKVNWETVPFCEIQTDNIEKFRLKENDIVFARTGATVGKSFLITKSIPKAVFASYLIRINLSKQLSSKYIYYFFQSANYWRQISTKAIGSGQPNVNANSLSNIVLPLCGINEQNRIVLMLEEKLSCLEKSKELLELSLDKLKVYRKLALNIAFAGQLKYKVKNDLTRNLTTKEKEQKENLASLDNVLRKEISNLKELPQYWGWVRLRDIALHIDYGYSGKSSNEIVGPKLLRITDIQDNKVNWNSVPHSKISNERKSKFLLKEGDLLFARTGATVGKSYLITSTPHESIFASYLIRVRLGEDVNKRYVSYFFQSDLYWEQIVENKSGVAQPNVNGTKLSNLIIPCPLKKEQDQIVKSLDSIMSICDYMSLSIKESLLSIELTKKSLLNKAFTGNLLDQDITDESAIILLGRVKVEKDEYLIREKEQKNAPLKVKIMETTKSILEILNENIDPIPSKQLWLSSDKKDDIEEFYAELKKHIESGDIIELPRDGKDSFLKLAGKS